MIDFFSATEQATDTTPETALQQPAPQKTPVSDGINFVSSGAGISDAGDILPVSEADMFNFAADQFEALSAKQNSGGGLDNSQMPEQPQQGALPPELIVISAGMYVEILEAVCNVLGRIFSGVEIGDYNFEKGLKKSYTRISEMYFKSANVQITPGQMFALMTIILIGGSAHKAYRDRKARIKVEQFRAKNNAGNLTKSAGEQLSIFSGENMPTVTGGAIRKKYDVDDAGNYTTTPAGQYAKKDEREKADPDTLTFIREFFRIHNRFPKHNEVKTYFDGTK